jgi:hypothetical protein
MTNDLYEQIVKLAQEADSRIFSSAFNDFIFCNVHKLLQPRYLFDAAKEDDVFQTCGACPKETNTEFNAMAALHVAPMPVGKAREHWAKHIGLVDDKGNMRTTMRTTIRERDNAQDVITANKMERGLWVEYLLSSYIEGLTRRSRIIEALRAGVKDDKALSAYDDGLLTFYNDCVLRSGMTMLGTSVASEEKLCVMYCAEHDAIGDLVPYRPAKLYLGCGVCIKKKVPARPMTDKSKTKEGFLFARSALAP